MNTQEPHTQVEGTEAARFLAGPVVLLTLNETTMPTYTRRTQGHRSDTHHRAQTLCPESSLAGRLQLLHAPFNLHNECRHPCPRTAHCSKTTTRAAQSSSLFPSPIVMVKGCPQGVEQGPVALQKPGSLAGAAGPSVVTAPLHDTRSGLRQQRKENAGQVPGNQIQEEEQDRVLTPEGTSDQGGRQVRQGGESSVGQRCHRVPGRCPPLNQLIALSTVNLGWRRQLTPPPPTTKRSPQAPVFHNPRDPLHALTLSRRPHWVTAGAWHVDRKSQVPYPQQLTMLAN